jgi:hypothetical protein
LVRHAADAAVAIVASMLVGRNNNESLIASRRELAMEPCFQPTPGLEELGELSQQYNDMPESRPVSAKCNKILAPQYQPHRIDQ